MKNSSLFATLIFTAISIAAVARPTSPGQESVLVIETHHKNQMLLRTDKSLKGASMVVYSDSGALVISQQLTSRKIIIDFKNVRLGTYTVQVKKENYVQEFTFKKTRMISDEIR